VRSNPLHDEVAIDYPSIGACIERVRRAFLADGERERIDTHHVLLQISGLQAYRGTVLSTEVPVRATCAVCGGRGETWSDPCSACEGSGIAHERALLRVPVPPRSTNGSRLYFRLHPPHAPSVRVEVTIAVTEALYRSRG
jgi:molecular chaperone DnaJ